MSTIRRNDENAWIVPGEWQDRAAPYRGHGGIAPITLDPKAPAALRKWISNEDVAKAVEATAISRSTDLADAARAALAEPESATPLGRAVLGGLAAYLADKTDPRAKTLHRLLDAWIGEYGVVVAAETAVLWAGIAFASTKVNREYQPAAARIEPDGPFTDAAMQLLSRLRVHLCMVPGDEYAAVFERLGRCRDGATLSVRGATSYLIPSQRDWLAHDLHSISRHDFIWYWFLHPLAVGADTPPEPLPSGFYIGTFTGKVEAMRALVHTGPAAAEFLAGALDAYYLPTDDQRQLGAMLAQLPTDTAYSALLERADRPVLRAALLEATLRFPNRAYRLLTATSPRTPLADALLRQLALVYPHTAAATGHESRAVSELASGAPTPITVGAVASGKRGAPGGLAGASSPPINSATPVPGGGVDAPIGRSVIDAVVEVDSDGEGSGCAAMSDLPELLRTPPWERGGSAATPFVLKRAPAAIPAAMAWLPGEQQEWATLPAPHFEPHEGWAGALAKVVSGEGRPRYNPIDIFALAPLELVTPHLDILRAHCYSGWTDLMRRVLGRFGDDIAPAMVEAVQRYPYDNAGVLMPVTGTAVTTLMTPLYSSKRGRATAQAWFERHLAVAAPDLVVGALGKPGKARVLAWNVLRAFDNAGNREIFLSAAADLGRDAASAFEAELSTDPLLHLPPELPPTAAWLTPSALPPIVLRESGTALPPQAVHTVCTMLALCSPDGDYAGITRFTAMAEPDSRARFAWGLFETWQLAGYPPAQGWIMHALGRWGDDDIARALTPYIRAWPGENGHARAVAGLEVLAAIGSGLALRQLSGIAETVKFKGIRAKAQAKIAQLAAEQGISADELADRLMPELGIAADGTLRLDYGTREFRIGVDEQLRPLIFDAQGRSLKTLSKPGVKDDPVLAAAAYKRFADFRKELKAVAAEQIQRLERAMIESRRWTVTAHRELFVDHHLTTQLARRLVWLAIDGDATLTFRIAEDGSFADAQDNPVTLATDAAVGIAHPLHLADTLPHWAERFSDYELLQPFPQLARPAYRLTDAERAATRIERFTDRVVHPAKLLGMTRFGWYRQEPQDAGHSWFIARPVPGGRSAAILLDPGLSSLGLQYQPDQRIVEVVIAPPGAEKADWPGAPARHRPADLDPVTASELLRELDILTA
ncbi:DUF4132 domain-containing protein [Nocardia sp. NPDC058058]|uniref:DUF4132 domain-containing protein n=1 Tax=Nocardia sp. NPDC058058 TaxID=3346317 RepID=UPI0036DE638C